jgi:hypothetical protein
LKAMPELNHIPIKYYSDSYGDLDHNTLLKTVYEKYPAYAQKIRVHKRGMATSKKGSSGRRANK